MKIALFSRIASAWTGFSRGVSIQPLEFMVQRRRFKLSAKQNRALKRAVLDALPDLSTLPPGKLIASNFEFSLEEGYPERVEGGYSMGELAIETEANFVPITMTFKSFSLGSREFQFAPPFIIETSVRL